MQQHVSPGGFRALHNRGRIGVKGCPAHQALARQTHVRSTPDSRYDSDGPVQRRARAAGIATEVCNHTFRGTAVTAYLENGGTLEKARQMAAHASTRTTHLYDRREEDRSRHA